MIALLTLGTLLAQPCLAQPIHHKHAKSVPVQSCAAPIVPMCFREPAPAPDIEPIPGGVYPYYIMTSADEESGSEDEGSYVGTVTVTASVGTLGAVEPIGGGGGTGYVPPTSPRPPGSAAQAPEISIAGASGGLTLVFAGIAIYLDGRKK